MSSAVYFGYGNMAYQSNACIGKHFLTIRRKLSTCFKAWGASGADVKFIVENCVTNIDGENHVICAEALRRGYHKAEDEVARRSATQGPASQTCDFGKKIEEKLNYAH